MNENISNPHHYARTASWLVIWFVLFRNVVQTSSRQFLWESPIQSFKCAVLCFFLCSLDFEISLKFSMKKVVFSRFRQNCSPFCQDSHFISYVCFFVQWAIKMLGFLPSFAHIYLSSALCHRKTVFLSANQMSQMFSSIGVLHKEPVTPFSKHFFLETTHNIQVAKTSRYLGRKSHHFIKAFSSKALVFKQYRPSGRFATRKCSKPLNSKWILG